MLFFQGEAPADSYPVIIIHTGLEIYIKPAYFFKNLCLDKYGRLTYKACLSQPLKPELLSRMSSGNPAMLIYEIGISINHDHLRVLDEEIGCRTDCTGVVWYHLNSTIRIYRP